MATRAEIRQLIDQKFGAEPIAIAQGMGWLPRPRLRITADMIDSEASRETIIVRFATFLLFTSIFCQKIGFGSETTKIGMPLLINFAAVAYMLINHRITFSPLRLGFYLIFVASCLLSQIVVNGSTSVTSIGELFVIYSLMTIKAPLSEAAYFRVLRNFILMMTIPAVIGLAQYGIQILNGQSGDPISMNKWFPHGLLIQGYYYDAHYPNWYDTFERPNGFFFLEPSFYSYFLAAAAIIEITYFRRPLIAAVLVLATLLSTGGTGMTMFVITFPLLLIRESPRVVLPVLIVGIIGVAVALAMGVHLPLVSRLDEMDTGGIGGQGGSAGSRMVVPLRFLIHYLSDSSFLISGMGAGATKTDFGSAWPTLKLVYEYGILAMLSFVALFCCVALTSHHNMPLKVSMIFVYHFTGGYLMDDVSIDLFVILCCMVAPRRTSKEETFVPFDGIQFANLPRYVKGIPK